MLHKDIDVIIRDLTVVSMPETVDAIANQFDMDLLQQISLQIQSILKTERKRLKPLEDELITKFGPSTIRHNLRHNLLSLDKANQDMIKKGDDESEKDLLKTVSDYKEIAKSYVKLKWVQQQLAIIIEKKINGRSNYDKPHDLTNTLRVSIRSKKVSDAFVLLKYGADIHDCNQDKQTLLHLAVEQNVEPIIMHLLNSGLKVDAKDNKGNTPLHFVTSVEAVDILLQNNAPIDALNYENESPLVTKLSEGKVDVAERLVECGANVNGKNRMEKPFLHYAIDNKDLVNLLIYHGANINAKDKDGDTALHLPHIKPDIAQHLISLGADITSRNYKGNTPLLNQVTNWCATEMVKILSIEDILNVKNLNGNTVLHQCVLQKKQEAVQYLIETMRADIEIRDSDGATALYCAMKNYAEFYKDNFLPVISVSHQQGCGYGCKR